MSQATLGFSRATHTCTHQNLYLRPQVWVSQVQVVGFYKSIGKYINITIIYKIY